MTFIVVVSSTHFLYFHYRDKLSKKQLARKLSLCSEVLKVTEIVETGIATKIGTYVKERRKELEV